MQGEAQDPVAAAEREATQADRDAADAERAAKLRKRRLGEMERALKQVRWLEGGHSSS